MKFILLLSLFFACSQGSKPLKYSKEELLSFAVAADSTVTFKLPRSLAEGVKCTDYTSGCISGHLVGIQKLDFIAVEFETEEQALFAAKKYRGYYSRNWFFDDVGGEPVLEKFVIKTFGAKKP